MSQVSYTIRMTIEKFDAEQVEAKEQAPGPGIEFFVTDHNLRLKGVSIERQKELYAEMKEHGLSSVRFDWDWREVMPEPGRVSEETLELYLDAVRAMAEAGLEPPIIVMSNPPEWAADLYKRDKEAFFVEYERYIETLASALERTGLRVDEVQLFNEINHGLIFRYIDLEDIPRAAGIARRTLGRVAPDVKLMTSLILANVNERTIQGINAVKRVTDAGSEHSSRIPELDEFLERYGEMLKASFDRVAVDYYPGTWHFPLRGVKKPGDAFPIPVSRNPFKELGNKFGRTFKDVDMLRDVCEKLARMGIEYELGEVGAPTNEPYKDERTQRLFYDMFFRAFRQMLVDFRSRGVALPRKVGLYETQDEPNVSFGGIIEKFLRTGIGRRLARLAPNPENDFGLKKASGEPKMILKGNKHRPPEEGEPSQLKKLIDYVNRPMG